MLGRRYLCTYVYLYFMCVSKCICVYACTSRISRNKAFQKMVVFVVVVVGFSLMTRGTDPFVPSRLFFSFA